MKATALLHVGPRRVACAEVALRPPGPGEVAIASLCSAISAGTEGMIYAGAFPQGMPLDATLGTLGGTFAYPFRYGYALVGRVERIGPEVEPDWEGAAVFVFHPHQDRVVAPLSACVRLPSGISPEAALYLPQVETALGLALDAAPLIGERAIVFGLGVVGLLVARLLADFPLARLAAVDPLAWRREQAQRWGIAETADPEAPDWPATAAGFDADLAVEVSGDPAALAEAIAATGYDGRIVVGSWYGARTVALDLGSRFHRHRQRLVSSQVSTLAPALTGRWDKARRLALAWRTLERLRPDRLPSRFYPLSSSQEAFEALCARPPGVMQFGFRY